MTGILSPHSILQRTGILQPGSSMDRTGILSTGDDPLAAIPLAMRLQTHRGEITGTTLTCIISGAGQAEANDVYIWDGVTTIWGKPAFQTADGSKQLYWEGGYPAWRLNPSSGGTIWYTNSNSNGDGPADTGWQVYDSPTPAPTSTTRYLPQYRTHGLYQDLSCTVPATTTGDQVAAWRDELSGSARTFIQTVSTKRPTLRFVSGIPVLRFDGVDDVLTMASSIPLTSALTVITARVDEAEDSTGNYSIFNTGTAHEPYWRFWLDGCGYVGVFRAVRASGYPAVMPFAGSRLFSISSGANFEMHIDGISQGVVAGNFSAAGVFYEIGANLGNGDGVHFKGDITAILICEDLGQRAAIEAHIIKTP